MKPITFLQNSPLQRKNNQSQTYLLTNETNEQLTKLNVYASPTFNLPRRHRKSSFIYLFIYFPPSAQIRSLLINNQESFNFYLYFNPKLLRLDNELILKR